MTAGWHTLTAWLIAYRPRAGRHTAVPTALAVSAPPATPLATGAQGFTTPTLAGSVGTAENQNSGN